MTNFNVKLSRSLALGAAVALLVACGGGGGNNGSASNPTGRLKLSVTDAPVDDAQAVWVQFRAVEFKPEGAEPVRQDLKDANGTAAPQRINLLPLQDGRAAVLLDGVVLPAGRYEWLRLLVDNEPNVRDSYIEIAGNECELRIPSGDESGLKLIRGFTLPEQGALALVQRLPDVGTQRAVAAWVAAPRITLGQRGGFALRVHGAPKAPAAPAGRPVCRQAFASHSRARRRSLGAGSHPRGGASLFGSARHRLTTPPR